MTKPLEILVYTDGGARGNPGPAAIGYAIFDQTGRCLESEGRCIGNHTNNEAEYHALILAIERVKKISRDRVKFHSDSELMVHQVNGVYKVKAEHLKAFVDKIREELADIHWHKLVYVPRENPRIQIADRLVNEALDGEGF